MVGETDTRTGCNVLLALHCTNRPLSAWRAYRFIEKMTFELVLFGFGFGFKTGFLFVTTALAFLGLTLWTSLAWNS